MKRILMVFVAVLGVGIATAFAQNPGDIIITEIMQNPAAVSDTYGEWFEIYNTTNSAIDINGWSMRDDGTNSHVIDNGGPLNVLPGDFLVLGRNGNSSENGGYTPDYVYTGFILANDADEIVLVANNGTIIDSVDYDGGPNFPDPNGASMVLTNFTLDNNVGANWATSTTAWPGSAGDLGSPGTLGPDATVLVELTSFSAIVRENSVELTWTTATETNNLGFAVERSKNRVHFEKIGFVRGDGTSAIPQGYSFTDNGLAPDLYYYRLKQIDTDGTFRFSPIVRVEVKLPQSHFLHQNYPNPFNPSTTIAFDLKERGRVVLKIYNLLGQEIITLVDADLEAGFHKVQFHAKGIPAGIYFYKLSVNGFEKMRKMIFLE